jgi:hypothetical protein
MEAVVCHNGREYRMDIYAMSELIALIRAEVAADYERAINQAIDTSQDSGPWLPSRGRWPGTPD